MLPLRNPSVITQNESPQNLLFPKAKKVAWSLQIQHHIKISHYIHRAS
jgi:hypothetical protein